MVLSKRWWGQDQKVTPPKSSWRIGEKSVEGLGSKVPTLTGPNHMQDNIMEWDDCNRVMGIL